MTAQKTVLLSTPTSATGSLWRIVQDLAPKPIKPCAAIDHYLRKGAALNDINSNPLPDGFDMYLFNQPHVFNFDQNLDDVRFIVNFRDPRDLCCNQYHWVFEHPVAPDMQEKMEQTRTRVREAGIDKYCLDANIAFFYNKIMQLFEVVPREKILVVSYAQICLVSDELMDRLATFLGSTATPAQIEEIKKREFPSALQDNPGWASGKWVGADVLPGRARIELKRPTYLSLSQRYSKILKFMQDNDLPGLAAIYR